MRAWAADVLHQLSPRKLLPLADQCDPVGLICRVFAQLFAKGRHSRALSALHQGVGNTGGNPCCQKRFQDIPGQKHQCG